MAFAERECQNRQTGDAVLGFSASQVSWTRSGFQCPGHSNWTIWSRLGWFCFGIFQKVLSLYWEANSYYPRGLILRKGTFSKSRNGWDKGFSVPGAFKLDQLEQLEQKNFQKISKTWTFILGLHFLNTPEGRKGKWKSWKVQKCQQHLVFPGGLPSKN